jgi:hypothetical protein
MATVERPSMKKLPIGISTLGKMLPGNYVYVDKTRHILSLTEAGGYYFLSRPRRFGKSLLIDTLRELFSGNEALFTDLYIHPHWGWSVKYPVIPISFGSGVLKSRAELDERITDLLRLNQQRLGIHCDRDSIAGHFSELIRKTQEKFKQRVVILNWFETGTPGFLVDLLKTRYYHLPDLEELEVSPNQLGDFDIDRMGRNRFISLISKSLMAGRRMPVHYNRSNREIMRRNTMMVSSVFF